MNRLFEEIYLSEQILKDNTTKSPNRREIYDRALKGLNCTEEYLDSIINDLSTTDGTNGFIIRNGKAISVKKCQSNKSSKDGWHYHENPNRLDLSYHGNEPITEEVFLLKSKNGNKSIFKTASSETSTAFSIETPEKLELESAISEKMKLDLEASKKLILKTSDFVLSMGGFQSRGYTKGGFYVIDNAVIPILIQCGSRNVVNDFIYDISLLNPCNTKDVINFNKYIKNKHMSRIVSIGKVYSLVSNNKGKYNCINVEILTKFSSERPSGEEYEFFIERLFNTPSMLGKSDKDLIAFFKGEYQNKYKNAVKRDVDGFVMAVYYSFKDTIIKTTNFLLNNFKGYTAYHKKDTSQMSGNLFPKSNTNEQLTNPSDIYMIKNGFSLESSISYSRELFNSKNIIGISLKKLSGNEPVVDMVGVGRQGNFFDIGSSKTIKSVIRKNNIFYIKINESHDTINAFNHSKSNMGQLKIFMTEGKILILFCGAPAMLGKDLNTFRRVATKYCNVEPHTSMSNLWNCFINQFEIGKEYTDDKIINDFTEICARAGKYEIFYNQELVGSRQTLPYIKIS